ncbi:purine-nucleoside phosphorylase [Clostridium saccharoperbutylacetonicum]|jgi:purine-nucleoside phosphorylase|uniref:Purine nucleoside phosphorylase DeoD-type n=1 Tax=Clostridium saccharoperbutylacetonicum N1-4(HMT) TaxID=931276 RepID=M1MKT1_9CLOT|nr:purine-nucleoside phosphorylase [Clostridium saccharoperbutylacetonicum]AGF55421.1 purine nucleoside phosphorylase DeoD-type [Clostridium saccharoperbutylacetonicum N1-4(HMT)]AQR94320.1 purine nucleoside phosphorylase DeoD-type [Clostridium saccharoperbutylacetonicum]NRT63865.1 purine-nucleoside phosphorylase [Clostridium saccharoperbutylacetonicum]NSB27229.1 purine-nucleoside phosphorylase [Clostridium saccharoperbutylacetonicum]NSB30019.1 purine-nucleoside phosphorylase [Clostridium sacch
MSVHINAPEGAIAESVLLPGDPLRAKFIAETFLEDAVCYNEVRGMYGFTGTYKGKRISVQGTGMGIPSISIYANELVQSYGVKNLIRVGTCGGYSEKVKIRDLIIAMSASTDSNLNLVRFQGRTFAPTASFELLKPAYDIAVEKGLDPKVGSIYSSDVFYGDDNEDWKKWAKFGCLGVEMEAAALYTIAAKFGVNALALLTVSDHFVTGEVTSAEERQLTFTNMMEVALDTIVQLDK